MQRNIIFALLFICCLLLNIDCYSKNIWLNNRTPLAEQMTIPNATYIFEGDYDLRGAVISCPYGSILRFKKGTIVHNGVIKGNQSTIKVCRSSKGFFDGVKLSGNFLNKKSYLSWWVKTEDITDNINSLFTAFGGSIFLDKGGRISNCLFVTGKDNVIIDGCGNTFSLHNIPNNCFFAKKNKRIEFKNINIDFTGCNTTGENAIMRCFRVEHNERSNVSIHDISIHGFSNVYDRPCSFIGINVMYCNACTNTEIYNIKVSDISVKGDGVEVQHPGGNYGIVVSCDSNESGIVEVHHCTIERMYNIDANNNKIYEDTSGIYLAGRYTDAGNVKDSHWHVSIHDCFFEDVSKRNIKVQGNYALIYNLESNCTESFLQDFKNMYIGAEGDFLKVEHLRGRYDGTIVKITGDYLSAKDIRCFSSLTNSNYARVFTLDGCLNASIIDCSFDNDTYIFIYPTELGFTQDVHPSYSFSNCTLNVKHLLYCVSKQTQIFEEGVLVINDSNIKLSSTICFNGYALKEIVINNSNVVYNDRLFEPRKDSKSVIITNNNSSLKDSQ